MADRRRSCWCGAERFRAFSADYLRCTNCETLVGQAGLSDEETLVKDDEVDYYGKRYWLEHQRQVLGLPDIRARVRQDLPERCVHWLKTLLGYRQPPATVLEIGAGHGAYTALLRWAGYDATALDLSSWVAEFARETFGIPYLVGPVEEQDLEPQSLDVIVANDVLEHLAHPHTTLARCAQLLKPDGLLVIQTPDYPVGRSYEELVAADDLFLKHLEARDEHLYLFSRAAIELLLGRSGLGEVAFEEPVYTYDMFCVASALPLVRKAADAKETLGVGPCAPFVLALIDAHDALRSSERDRAARLEAIEELDAALKVSEADRAARLQAIEQLDGSLKDSEADRRLRFETIERLEAALAESEADRTEARAIVERLEAESAERRDAEPPTVTRLEGGRDYRRRASELGGHEGDPAWPWISVVTPVFNGADMLEDCIASVFAQNYPNVEYIVIDGGSSDGTLGILERADQSISYWASEPDTGQADAINKGFSRSTGELVCWLNADDFFYPEALIAAREAYLADPEAPFYFGNGYRVDREGRKLAEFFPEGRVHFRRDALLFGLNCILQPSTFIRRDALERVGLVDASLHYGFDTDLWIRLSALGRPRPINKHLAASREYGKTKTSTGSFGRAEELRRIAEQHAEVAATPGSVCYYLDTLHRLAVGRPDVFPREYLAAIESFWSATARLFSSYGARPDGFPLPSDPELVHATPRLRRKDSRTRIGIELRQVTRGASGGIVVVLAGTLQELFRRHPDIDFVVFCTVFNHELLAVDAPNVEIITLPLDNFFPELARMSRDGEIDVLLRSYPTAEEVDFPLKRQVFLLPDVQHEYHPEFFDAQTMHARRQAFRIPLEGAGAIMTISDHARQTIEERADPDCDVFVASPSLPPEFLDARSEDVTQEEEAALPTHEFFFFPANLWPHKNHERLFEALRSFRARTGSRLELILTGEPAGWDELRSRYADLPITHLGYVSPALMRLIYERALALTFFSQYEGFGIPLLEAFDAGTPVICSNTTSLPDVAGNAALMCDPTDVAEMSALLERVAGDPDLRAELVERGKQRLAAFSWQIAADALAGGIERLVKRLKSPELDVQPLVSIVTPSYNQGHFLRRTIDSVLGQSYRNIEYLVVDGGSTDGTLDVVHSYGERIRWLSEPDSGQTSAINKGLSLARGEIVGYLNSDDVLRPDAISKVVEYFRDHPSCDLVYGDADYIDENDEVIGTYPTAPYSFDRLLQDCCICQPAAYWRTRAAEEIGPFDERLDYAMDYDYWLRFDRSGFVIRHMPETIAQSRIHPMAKTFAARRAIYREIFDVCRRRAGYISRNYVDGFWYFLVYERRHVHLRVLARLPKLRALLVSVHHRWLNRQRYMRRQWVAAAALRARGRLVARLTRTPRLFAPVLLVRNRLRGLRARVERRAMPSLLPVGRGGRPRVNGYWPDNWVGRRLEVVVDARVQGRMLRLVGQPVAPMTVEVFANDTPLAECALVQNGRQAVDVHLPPGPEETIIFAFSEHVLDEAGRPLAFLLQETNLFSEGDLHALV